MNETNEQPQTAGAFDIRNFIGVLLAIFGIILVFAGLVGFTPDEARRTGGIDANLWTGIGLIVAAIVFIGWAKVRPLRIDDTPSVEPEGPGETGGIRAVTAGIRAVVAAFVPRRPRSCRGRRGQSILLAPVPALTAKTSGVR